MGMIWALLKSTASSFASHFYISFIPIMPIKYLPSQARVLFFPLKLHHFHIFLLSVRKSEKRVRLVFWEWWLDG